MKENTLYDIISKIETVISDLSYFEESEALNVSALQDAHLNSFLIMKQ